MADQAYKTGRRAFGVAVSSDPGDFQSLPLRLTNSFFTPGFCKETNTVQGQGNPVAAGKDRQFHTERTAKMLHIKLDRAGFGVDLWKIEGFTEQELDELNSMEYREMKDKILDMIDSRQHNHWNKALGTTWKCGCGVYNAYIMNHAVYLEIGKSCD